MKNKKPFIISIIAVAVLAFGIGAFFLVRTIIGNLEIINGVSDGSANADNGKLITYPQMIEVIEEAYDTEIVSDNKAKKVTGAEAVLEVMRANGLINIKAAKGDTELTDEKIVKYSVELAIISEEKLNTNITRNDLDEMIASAKRFNFSEQAATDYEIIEVKDGIKEISYADIISLDETATSILLDDIDGFSVGDFLLVEGSDGIKLARQVEAVENGELSLVNAEYSDVFTRYEAKQTLHINPETMQEYIVEAGGELLYIEPLKDSKLADLGLSGDGAIPLMGDEILSDVSWGIEFSYVSSNDFSESDIARVSLTIFDYEKQVKFGYVVPLDSDNLGPVSFSVKLDVVKDLTVSAHADLVGEMKAGITMSGEFNLSIYADAEKTINVPIPALNYGGSVFGVIKAQAGFSYFLDLNGELNVTINHINPCFDMEIDLRRLSVSFPKAPEPENDTTVSWEVALSIATGLRLGFDVKAGDFRITGGSYLGIKDAISAMNQDDGCICINSTVGVPYVKAAVLVAYPNFGAKTTGTLNISKELDPIKSWTDHLEIKPGESIEKLEKCSYGNAITPVEYVTEDAQIGQQIIDTTVSMALNAYADYFENFVSNGYLSKMYDGNDYYLYKPELGRDEEIWFGLAYLNDDDIPEFIYGIHPTDYQISGSAALLEKATVLTYARGQVVIAGELGMHGKFSYVPKYNGMLSYELKTANPGSEQLHLFKMINSVIELQEYGNDVALETAADELYSQSTFTTYYERGRLTSQNLAVLRTDEWWIFLDGDGTLSDLEIDETGEEDLHLDDADGPLEYIDEDTVDWENVVLLGHEFDVDLDGDGIKDQVLFAPVSGTFTSSYRDEDTEDLFIKYLLSINGDYIDVHEFVRETGLLENMFLDEMYVKYLGTVQDYSIEAVPDIRMVVADIDTEDNFKELIVIYPHVFQDERDEGVITEEDAIFVFRYDQGLFLYSILSSRDESLYNRLLESNSGTLSTIFTRNDSGMLCYGRHSLNETDYY